MDSTQAYPSSVPERKTSRMAVASLVLGILSLLCLSILGGLPAIILGHKARGRIARSGGSLEGAGMALGGLITGYVSILLFFVMGAVLFVGYTKAKEATACISNLQKIDFAKEQWAMETEPAEGDVATPEQLNDFLDVKIEQLKCPAGGTYSINPAGKRPACTVFGHQLPD